MPQSEEERVFTQDVADAGSKRIHTAGTREGAIVGMFLTLHGTDSGVALKSPAMITGGNCARSTPLPFPAAEATAVEPLPANEGSPACPWLLPFRLPMAVVLLPSKHGLSSSGPPLLMLLAGAALPCPFRLLLPAYRSSMDEAASSTHMQPLLASNSTAPLASAGTCAAVAVLGDSPSRSRFRWCSSCLIWRVRVCRGTYSRCFSITC